MENWKWTHASMSLSPCRFDSLRYFHFFTKLCEISPRIMFNWIWNLYRVGWDLIKRKIPYLFFQILIKSFTYQTRKKVWNCYFDFSVFTFFLYTKSKRYIKFRELTANIIKIKKSRFWYLMRQLQCMYTKKISVKDKQITLFYIIRP